MVTGYAVPAILAFALLPALLASAQPVTAKAGLATNVEGEAYVDHGAGARPPDRRAEVKGNFPLYRIFAASAFITKAL